MDSIKQYNIAGVASTVELGKRGPKIVGQADQVSLKDNANRNLVNAEIADGTEAQHAITQAQLEEATQIKLTDYDVQVSFDSGKVSLGTILAGSTVLRVTMEKAAGNWLGTTADTNITVGTDAQNDLLFAVFDPETQSVDETNHVFDADTELSVFVNAGGATAGTAVVRIVYAGSFVPAA